MNTHIHTGICIPVYANMDICIHTWIHTDADMYTYTNTHTHNDTAEVINRPTMIDGWI